MHTPNHFMRDILRSHLLCVHLKEAQQNRKTQPILIDHSTHKPTALVQLAFLLPIGIHAAKSSH